MQWVDERVDSSGHRPAQRPAPSDVADVQSPGTSPPPSSPDSRRQVAVEEAPADDDHRTDTCRVRWRCDNWTRLAPVGGSSIGRPVPQMASQSAVTTALPIERRRIGTAAATVLVPRTSPDTALGSTRTGITRRCLPRREGSRRVRGPCPVPNDRRGTRRASRRHRRIPDEMPEESPRR